MSKRAPTYASADELLAVLATSENPLSLLNIATQARRLNEFEIVKLVELKLSKLCPTATIQHIGPWTREPDGTLWRESWSS
jgi:hypothetical protein